MFEELLNSRMIHASDHPEAPQGGLAKLGQTAARVVIDAAACLAVASPLTACTSCVDRYPTGAITLDDRVITPLDERCVGCGRCAAACPTEAIDVPGFGAIGAGPVECARVAPRDRLPGALVVPCLGGLKAVALLDAGPLLVDRG